MKRWSSLFAAAALTLVTVRADGFCRATTCNEAKQLCAKDGDGCTTEGVAVAWSASTIPYQMHDRGSRNLVRSETRAAVRTAFGTWSDVLCAGNARTRLRFVEKEDVAIDPPATTSSDEPTRKLNGVFFRDEAWPYTRVGSNPLASTFRVYGNPVLPGTITSARIEVNTAERAFGLPDDGSKEPDLIAVLVHEVGHFIGIGHSRESESIMLETFCEEGSRCTLGRRASRRLAADDVAAVCALYPPGEPTSDAPTNDPSGTESSSAGCSASGQTERAWPWAWACALAVVVAVRARRQRSVFSSRG